ncbi:hypothetical protein TrispH2_004636 [Trichoplax sp. H2]|nr:hypothetical protein TrispH2_004636 [Trichoplax sp. H2]|eukprot:RDD44236.1 hypothetical protein TrispH2_004636 [Trichoplax sp. H2]
MASLRVESNGHTLNNHFAQKLANSDSKMTLTEDTKDHKMDGQQILHCNPITTSEDEYSQDESNGDHAEVEPVKDLDQDGSQALNKEANTSTNRFVSNNMSGYLYLCPNQGQDENDRQNYTKRWCVVGHQSFYLYETVYDTAPPENIYRLDHCRLVTCNEVRRIKNNTKQATGEKKLYVFELMHPNGRLVLGASNKTQQDSWVNAIESEFSQLSAASEEDNNQPIINQNAGDDTTVIKPKPSRNHRKGRSFLYQRRPLTLTFDPSESVDGEKSSIMKNSLSSPQNNVNGESKLFHHQAVQGSSCYGFLERKNAVGKWTSYWFTLSSMTLHCYKEPNDAAPSDSLLLRGYDVRAVGSRNHRYIFSLSTGLLKTYYYSCTSLETRTSWIYALSQAIMEASGKPKAKKLSILRKKKRNNDNQSISDNATKNSSEKEVDNTDSQHHDRQNEAHDEAMPQQLPLDSLADLTKLDQNDYHALKPNNSEIILTTASDSTSIRKQNSNPNSPQLVAKGLQESRMDKQQSAKEKLVSQLKAQKERLINSLNNSDIRLLSPSSNDASPIKESETAEVLSIDNIENEFLEKVRSKSNTWRLPSPVSGTPEISVIEQYNAAIEDENQRAARFDTQYKKNRNSIMLKRDEATKHLNNIKKIISNQHHRHIGSTIRKRTYSHSKANHQQESNWSSSSPVQRKNSLGSQDVAIGDSMEVTMKKYEKISNELLQMDNEIDRLDTAIKTNRKQQDTNVNTLTVKREAVLAKIRANTK